MGAIGGIVDFRNGNIDFSSFNSIRSAQTLRGRVSSVAYIDHGISMFYNYDGFFGDGEPILSERNGYKIAISADSRIDETKALMEAYRAYGVEFVGMIDAPFAISLYDAERRMLLLARDKKGRRPLFYQAIAGRVFFSSEAKGLFAVKDKPIKINTNMLSQHLTSPVGIYSVSDVCPEVCEIRAGECALFTEVGISKFFYQESQYKKITEKPRLNSGSYMESAFISTHNDIFSSISDSLIAFDMPQFDAYMPSLCRLFLNCREKGAELCYKDPIRRKNISYAYEREDRFSSFYGCIARGSAIKNSDLSISWLEDELKTILNILTENVFSFDFSRIALLRKIFGEQKFSLLMRYFESENLKKEDTEQKIRILGMICQTIEWSELRKLQFLSEEKKVYSYT